MHAEMHARPAMLYVTRVNVRCIKEGRRSSPKRICWPHPPPALNAIDACTLDVSPVVYQWIISKPISSRYIAHVRAQLCSTSNLSKLTNVFPKRLDLTRETDSSPISGNDT